MKYAKCAKDAKYGVYLKETRFLKKTKNYPKVTVCSKKIQTLEEPM